MTDRAREYDDAVPGPPGWSRPPAASSNRVRDKDDCAVGAGENCHWPECADEKGGCLMPIPEPGMHAIPNRVQPGTFGPVFDAGVEEGKRQARHATPNRVQPSIVNLDDGSVQIEWHCRQFDIEVNLSAEDTLEAVYVHDLVSGFKVDKDV